ncbi:MAG: MarR family transcriptional regulator [Acidobacteria bacterium]|nr:MAG: MarR family transcriptional regulator [Acidobacteriota bacterium]PYY08035.1 MAG: MarR family transcriptional regulator [Acidobacteriota bacterium]
MASRSSNSSRKSEISSSEYRTLSEFRRQLSAFLKRRRQAAESAGLEAQQYEFLLALKGLPDGEQPNIKQIAQQLLLKHHSAVELASRLERRGLVRRRRSPHDRRAVLLSLTRTGDKMLEQVAQYSFSQLRLEAPDLLRSLRRLLKPKAALK